MYNLAGKQWEYAVPAVGGPEFTVDTRPLATGVYVLHLGGRNFDLRKKILVR